MSRPLLCRFGIHNWTAWETWFGALSWHRVCKRCGREETDLVPMTSAASTSEGRG